MKKIENEKCYVQIKDILFISMYDSKDLTQKLKNKAFKNHGPLFKDVIEQYIELDEEESVLLLSKDYIYSKNDMDLLTNQELIDKLKKIENSINTINRTNDSSSNDIDLQILIYQESSLVEYLSNRLEKSCESCDNKYCEKRNQNIGVLDYNDKPMGNRCIKYINVLDRKSNY